MVLLQPADPVRVESDEDGSDAEAAEPDARDAAYGRCVAGTARDPAPMMVKEVVGVGVDL